MIAIGCVVLGQPWSVVREMSPRQLGKIMDVYQEMNKQRS